MAVVGACFQPTDYVSVDSVPLPISNRFPVSATAVGFCEEVENALGPIQGLPANFYFAGAFTVEGKYTEPITGQIWPR